MSHVSRLRLTNFRNYETATFEVEGASGAPVVLTGPNGAGKTNVLEALSLFSPGRGMRSARLSEMQNRRSESAYPWSISAAVSTPCGAVKIGTGMDPASEKRIVRIDGETVRSQNAMTEYLSCVWLTPQMDRIFLDSSGARRRFLDRLVFTFDPGHSGRVTRYENALGQRSKLLREGVHDTRWLSALEAQIAETGVAVAAARADFIERLQKACVSVPADEKTCFPSAGLKVSGKIETELADTPALRVEERFRYELEKSRAADAVTGGASSGPHRSDFIVHHMDSGMHASQCSTGEQKALLTGIVLAHSRLIEAERGSPPLLLLDEVAAHLDEARRAALFGILLNMKCQAWLTGTDRALFSALEGRAGFFSIRNANVTA